MRFLGIAISNAISYLPPLQVVTAPLIFQQILNLPLRVVPIFGVPIPHVMHHVNPNSWKKRSVKCVFSPCFCMSFSYSHESVLWLCYCYVSFFHLIITENKYFFTFIFLFFAKIYQICHQISFVQRKNSEKLRIRSEKLQIRPQWYTRIHILGGIPLAQVIMLLLCFIFRLIITENKYFLHLYFYSLQKYIKFVIKYHFCKGKNSEKLRIRSEKLQIHPQWYTRGYPLSTSVHTPITPVWANLQLFRANAQLFPKKLRICHEMLCIHPENLHPNWTWL